MPRKPIPPAVHADEDVRVLAMIPLRDPEPGYPAEQFRVVSKRYRGEEKVDLRTFYQDKQGEWRPTPRGTLLPRSAVAAIKSAVDRLCDATVDLPPKAA